MNNLNYNFENKAYHSHIVKQLCENMLSDLDFSINLGKYFKREKQVEFDEVIYEDNIYIQSISALINKDLNYFIKSLEIIIEEANYKWTMVDLKYNYYSLTENISESNIKISFISNVIE